MLVNSGESSLRSRSQSINLRWLSGILLIAAIILLTFQLIGYSRGRANFPPGLVVANVPVGGVSRQNAAQRLLEVYNQPVALQYEDALIYMDPSIVDFNLNLESMIAAADLERTESSFWGGFWDYLWGNRVIPSTVPLDADYSEEALNNYLSNELAARYDKPPTPAQPVAGSTRFSDGIPGTTIDNQLAIPLIEAAIFSPDERSAVLPLRESAAPRPNYENLQVQLQQIMDVANYDGLADIYLYDLGRNEELHFVYQLGEEFSTDPDVSFTAASIIKIPILLSIFARIDGAPSDHTANLLDEMIIQSFNEPADTLMEENIDATQGPLIITEDLRSLGLTNTFLAGQFYIGAPLLAVIDTPAQNRIDVFTDPDAYNQTTPMDIGTLLADIYQCSENGGGAIAAVFAGKVTQDECREMINLLTRNQLGILLEAGSPEGTRIAHKHGWVTNPNTGVTNTIGDAGIVFTPSGDYVAVIFLYQPVQLIWDPISTMFKNLSEAIYNYFTLPAQS